MKDMLIKDIRTTGLRIPYEEQPAPGWRASDAPREFLVVEVETANGTVGMGYIQPLQGGLQTLARCIHEMLAPLLLGEDAREVEALWEKLYRATYTQGRMGLTMLAQSALDIALWDALGKHAKLPLFRLWGGKGGELPIYGSGCFRGLGREGMIAKAERYVKQGFDAIKMQVAHVHTPAEDLRNVRAMREALGPDVAIMIDVNMGWTAEQAIATGRRLEAFDIAWLEEPVPAEDFAGYRRVARALSIPIVGGENHFGRYDMRPFFADPCVAMLQPDVMRGGLTELRKVAAVADTWGIRIAPHLFHELMAHLLASIPNGTWLEYMGWSDDLWVHPLLPVGGKVTVPERPGHGLAFKPAVLREYKVKL